MSKDPALYLHHILECIDKVQRYTRNGRDSFLHEELVQDAVYRNLEIIGVITPDLRNGFHNQHPLNSPMA
ncbi:MAG: DUF86 domain-containing protein [Magnetococcales bacterium]|nr:DUF86 domain-containing protein [Magnetococcales bacterium]